MNNENIYHVIAKYLNGNITEEETLCLQKWCSQSKENEEEFFLLRKVWLASNDELNSKIKESKSRVWDKILKNIPNVNLKKYSKRSVVFYSSISVAVTIFLIICINIFMNKFENADEIQYVQMYMPKGGKGQLLLPDGTKVWLNSNSTIKFSNTFNSQNRDVTLEGEAYFEVANDTKHQFTVNVDNVSVIVHGTAFNVTAYNESANISVILQHGSVSILNNMTKTLISELKPNDKIVIHKNNLANYEKQSIDSDKLISWTFEELVFEFSTIDEVYSRMENWYGVNIKVLSAKKDLKYRFKIKTESLTEILELINKMTPIDYDINGKEVIITYR